jgi:hypothetical protein
MFIEKVKDRKRRPEGVNESRNKISLETFGCCPKITAKHKQVSKLKYQRQLVTRVSRKIPRNDRKTTQRTEHKSELKHANSRWNKKLGNMIQA